jgi:predicted dehydrogenase
MLKVAIIGCGKIADSHVCQIQRIPGCEIVGVCDSELLMAKQLYDRFPVGRYFDDLDELLEEARPDVVHITSPPQSHFAIGKCCMEKGCHIFVEKPFTLNTDETEKLLALAEQAGRKVTIGHDAQFSDVSIRMRKLVREGYLGSRVVHMESIWCYEFGDVTYAKTLLEDKRHWARTLPGGLLHNILNHGISKIAEYLATDDPDVYAEAFVSPFLLALGERSMQDELRVMIRERGGTTAYFTFSSQMQPSLHQFRVYGDRNSLLIDEDQRILIKLRGSRFKSYAEHFFPPLGFAKQYLGNFSRSFRLFAARKFQMDLGKKNLIESFYKSIVDKVPVPIPYREILLTSRIMDSIFSQIAARVVDVYPQNERLECR